MKNNAIQNILDKQEVPAYLMFDTAFKQRPRVASQYWMDCVWIPETSRVYALYVDGSMHNNSSNSDSLNIESIELIQAVIQNIQWWCLCVPLQLNDT